MRCCARPTNERLNRELLAGPQSVDRQVKFRHGAVVWGYPHAQKSIEQTTFLGIRCPCARKLISGVPTNGCAQSKSLLSLRKFEFPVKKWTKTLCAPIMHPKRFLCIG